MTRNANQVEPTGLQLEILQILWELGEGSVAQVHEALATRGRKLAYTTVMTLCKRMADRGLLTFVQRDRAYIYSPASKRESFLRRFLGGIADRAFRGSEAQLAMAVLADARIDPDELSELQRLLAKKQREIRTRGKPS